MRKALVLVLLFGSIPLFCLVRTLFTAASPTHTHTLPLTPTTSNLSAPPNVWGSNRFLMVCVAYGRHNNQLIALAKAYSIAYHTNRTLILPMFFQKRTGFNAVESFYDVFDGPVAVVTLAAFMAHYGTREWKDSLCVDYDRQCKGLQYVTCGGHVHTHVRDANVFARSLAGPQPMLVMGGQNTFLANVPHWPCMYHHLKLKPTLQHNVTQFIHTRLQPRYAAVHLRFFENKCELLAARQAKALQSHEMRSMDVRQMCAMQPQYFRQFWNTSGHYFVAHDHQSPKSRYNLLAADGVIFLRSDAIPDLHALLIEFWLCVDAEVFVGNSFSTMSLNICAVRRARGKPCANMDPIFDKYPCFPHPDLGRHYAPEIPSN
eukprot:NODE_2275_length_1225_cov_77.780510_g2163_i0.p1 GENE.NODE_2275_length_1225_cov_77.780510_g2163_i0~~NODE_2275_length_1225_cov_77.780510_g2163_i0.p1  ORF type:complete len:374 (-),score=70.31 NODE_2275_length_1225_cov_77.780510_g2163_i0:39-1160(-)